MNSIISEAIERYRPEKILMLFSGGHDSLCSTHYASIFLNEIGRPFTIYHGNTGIGIGLTRDFVVNICKGFNWELFVGHPAAGETYEDLVRKYGFPGPASHKYMYRNLKEKPLKRYITHSVKNSPYARENVLLITGIRRLESKIRMGYKDYIRKEDSRIWCSPIFYWSEEDCSNYMEINQLPRNPVKEKICISGECLCGAFARRGEYMEIKECFPDAAAEIDRLHRIAAENGKPWHWASNPKAYYKMHPEAQLTMFMCAGCEQRRVQ